MGFRYFGAGRKATTFKAIAYTTVDQMKKHPIGGGID